MKHVLITGVSRGIGRALAETFAAAGHAVAGCARDADALAALHDALAGPRARHTVHALDLTDVDAVRSWIDDLAADWAVPDLVINNAGLITDRIPGWEVDDDAFGRLIDVNVKGVFHVCRAVLPRMIARNAGVVVNISSGWAHKTSPGVAPYCASKYAIEGLTQALAKDLVEVGADGVATVPFNPGRVQTEMLRTAYGDAIADTTITPTEWAAMALPVLLALGPADSGRSINAPRPASEAR